MSKPINLIDRLLLSQTLVCWALVLAVSSTAKAQLGDFNGDGSWNCLDIDALVNDIVTTTNDLQYDMDGSGFVDQADITQWLIVGGGINNAGGAPYGYGDSNLDGVFNSSDLVAIFGRGEFEDATDGNSGWADGVSTSSKKRPTRRCNSSCR